jgi:anti-sigma B factor antagonist
MDLRLRSRKAGDVTVVEVGGEVELHSANQLRDELSRAGESERPCVIVDLSRVSFIDSTGLGVLVGAFKRVRERGHLALVCPQRSVRRVLEITGLGQVFPLFNRVEDALASFPLKDGASVNVRSAGKDSEEPSTRLSTHIEGGERHD